MASCVPVGASKWVGASLSSRARKDHGNKDCKASDKSPAENAFSEVLSSSAGTSQVSRSVFSPSSDTSGHGFWGELASAARKNIARSRHCLIDFDHGS